MGRKQGFENLCIYSRALVEVRFDFESLEISP